LSDLCSLQGVPGHAGNILCAWPELQLIFLSLVCYPVGRGRTHTNTHTHIQSHPCPTNKNSPDKSPIGSLACIQHTLRSIWRASTLEAKLNVMQSILPMLHCQGYRRGTCVQSMCGKTRNGPTNQSLIMIHLVKLIIIHK